VNNLIIKEADKILGKIIKYLSQIHLKILHGDNYFVCGVASRKVRRSSNLFLPHHHLRSKKIQVLLILSNEQFQ